MKLRTEVQVESDELQLAAHCLPAAAAAAAPDIQEQEQASSCWGSGTSAGGSGTPFSSSEDQTLYGFRPAGIAAGAAPAAAAVAVSHDGCTLAPSSLPHSATAMQSEEGGAAATSAWDADFDHETMQAIKLSLETIAYCDEKGPRAATLPSLQRVLLVEDSDMDDDDGEEPVAATPEHPVCCGLEVTSASQDQLTAGITKPARGAVGGLDDTVDEGNAGPGGCRPGTERQPQQQAAAADQGAGRSGATEAPTPAAAAAARKAAVAATAASSSTYLLQGAVLHHGLTPFSGHYTASVLCNPGRVSHVSSRALP